MDLRNYYDVSVPPSLFAAPEPHVEATVMAAKAPKNGKAKASTPEEPPPESSPEGTSDEPPAEG